MKKITLLMLLLAIGFKGIAQKIDWVNEPLNPVPVFYTANHYNIKGPIKVFSAKSMGGEVLYLYFNETGKLVEKITTQASGFAKILFTYQYDSKGKLISETTAFLDSKGSKTYENTIPIIVNDKDLVIQKGTMLCSYDNNNRLVLILNKDKNGKVNYKQEFVYNKNFRF